MTEVKAPNQHLIEAIKTPEVTTIITTTNVIMRPDSKTTDHLPTLETITTTTAIPTIVTSHGASKLQRDITAISKWAVIDTTLTLRIVSVGDQPSVTTTKANLTSLTQITTTAVEETWAASGKQEVQIKDTRRTTIEGTEIIFD